MVRVFFGVDAASASATEKRVAEVGANVSKAFAFNELKEAATGVFDLLRTGFEKFDHVARHADEIGDLAEKIGLTAEELEFFQFAAEEAGGSADSIALSFKAITQQIGAASDGSKEATQAFADLGVALHAGGELRSTADVFNDVVKSLQNIKNPTEQAVKAQNIFGRSWQDIRLMLKGGPEQMAKLREEFEGLGMAITPEFLELSDRYDKAIRRLGKSWEGFKRQALEPVIRAFTGLIENFLEWYRINRFDVAAIAATGFRDLTNVLKAFYDMLEPVITAVGAIYKALDDLTVQMGPWGGVVKGFGEIMALAFKSPALAVAALGATIAQDLLYYFTDKGPSAIGYFIEHWDESIDHLRKTFGDFAADSVKWFGETIASFVNGLRKLVFYASELYNILGSLGSSTMGDGAALGKIKDLFSARGDAKYLETITEDDMNKKFGKLSGSALEARQWDLAKARGEAAGMSPAGSTAGDTTNQVNVTVTPSAGREERGLAEKVGETVANALKAQTRKTYTQKGPASK
jgi:hypothetical protein